MASFFIRI